MNLLQILLIVSGFLVLIIWYDFFKKRRLNWFQIFLLIWIALSILIFTLFPDTLRLFWKIFWLQRWADALVYISILSLWYIVISLYNKILDNRKDITELTREIAFLKYKLKNENTKK